MFSNVKTKENKHQNFKPLQQFMQCVITLASYAAVTLYPRSINCIYTSVIEKIYSKQRGC